MRCPYCRAGESKVIDSREVEESVRRRRECQHCSQRFTTYERLETANLLVIKKDGRREEYDRAKLARGIKLACAKRSIPASRVEQAIAAVEGAIYALGKAEVPSQRIGEYAMSELREIDQVAYIRYTSVYLGFEDLERMKQEMETLLNTIQTP